MGINQIPEVITLEKRSVLLSQHKLVPHGLCYHERGTLAPRSLWLCVFPCGLSFAYEPLLVVTWEKSP